MGDLKFRQKIAAASSESLGWEVTPDNVLVTSGATEAMLCAFLALLNPGDEVSVPSPSYENPFKQAYLVGAVPVAVPFDPPDFILDSERVRTAISPRTKIVVLITPHNPTGRCFTQAELKFLAEIVIEHDLILVTDEMYKHFIYEGRHFSPGSLSQLWGRTLVIEGASKDLAIAGWRIGWVMGPKELIYEIWRAHNFVGLCAPHPFQAALATRDVISEHHYTSLRLRHKGKRDLLTMYLESAGFSPICSQGTYYTLADITPLNPNGLDSFEFAKWMLETVGVAAVPGCAFNWAGDKTMESFLRFSFGKSDATITAAGNQLLRLKGFL